MERERDEELPGGDGLRMVGENLRSHVDVERCFLVIKLDLVTKASRRAIFHRLFIPGIIFQEVRFLGSWTKVGPSRPVTFTAENFRVGWLGVAVQTNWEHARTSRSWKSCVLRA